MNGTLTIKRFNGDEIWNLTEGSFSITESPEGPLLNFWVKSNGELLSEPLEDSHTTGAPSIELQSPLNELKDKKSLVGLDVIFNLEDAPDDDDLIFANFYYYSHETPLSNKVSIIEEKNNLYHIISISSTVDVNYYDGSKPQNEIFIDCWIEKSDFKNGKWTI